jgi:hypothetical protein
MICGRDLDGVPRLHYGQDTDLGKDMDGVPNIFYGHFTRTMAMSWMAYRLCITVGTQTVAETWMEYRVFIKAILH